METQFLESFIAVANHGSLAGAARQLGVTPAAVGQRLRALEAELGITLVARAGRTVSPTEAGSAILARARSIIEQVHDLRGEVAGAAVGSLRLGSISTALTGLIPQVLAALAVACPRIETLLEPGSSPDLYDKVVRGHLDAALIVRPKFELPKNLAWHLVRAEPLVVLAARKHAAADPRRLLQELPFIRMHNKWGQGVVEQYLAQHKIRTKDRYEIDSLEAIAVLVDRGLGVALVPDWAPPWPAGLKLQKITLTDAPVREVGMIWARSSTRVRLVQAFLDAASSRPPSSPRARGKPRRG